MKYKVHNEAMRRADQRFNEERDRRYTEVNVEKEKALKIKETADLTALELARESQMYKDERNDQMRETNLKETGIYATRDDLAQVFAKSEKNLTAAFDELKTALKPMLDHVAADTGSQLTIGRMIAYIVAVGVILGIIFSAVNYII